MWSEESESHCRDERLVRVGCLRQYPAVVRIYTYEKCDTCRKALKFLAARGIAPENIPIRNQPPSKTELRRMFELVGGDVRKLFNTSGRDYKELRMGERLASMTLGQAFDLLATNGNLVKRPFLFSETGGTVGFKEETWQELFPG